MTENKSLIWDETFPALILKGEGTYSFLHGQTTADVYAQKELEKPFMSCWLSTKGILKALLEIRLLNNMAEIVIISGETSSIIKGFESVIFPADKVNLDVAKPIRRIQKINNIDSWKTSDSYWIDNNKSNLKEINKYIKATKEELIIWKIRQGIPSFGREINGETNPCELGLSDTINLKKGCYLGQEAIARLYRSKSLKYELRCWVAHGENDDLDLGKELFDINKDQVYSKKIGVITSSIRVKDNLFNGLALIKKKFLDNDICFSERGVPVNMNKPISFSQPY